MGIFNNLLETYDKCSSAIGIVQKDADGTANEKRTLLPIFHMTFKSEICVTIDENGNFVDAERDAKEQTIIIPCTEKSAGRASGIAAHPLCDQIDYVGNINEKKMKAYLEGLKNWKRNCSILNAIYIYVENSTMIGDFQNKGIIKESEYCDAENVEECKKIEKDNKILKYCAKKNSLTIICNNDIRKIGVRFQVQTKKGNVKVWEDKGLRKQWIDHLIGGTSSGNKLFDYLSGNPVGSIATQHPKNINSMTGNAKLLSCNDTSGFTFRGRFDKQDDAVIIDSEQSQKMHQMLRWLISNYGYNIDSQTIIAWAVDGNTKAPVNPFENSFDLFGELDSKETDADVVSDVDAMIYADYTKKLSNILLGYGNAQNLKQHSRKICIAALDAATTGRMGLTFYQELPEDTYLENIVNWHNDTSYYLTAWLNETGEDGKEKNKALQYIGAPSYDDILFAVYGKPRAGKDSGYNTLKRKMRKQLLECMFGNFSFPKSMVDAASTRASHPMSFTDANGSFSKNDWGKSINITCALVRKYYKQQTKEDIQLELDEKRAERDYLYGRLLAVADKLEKTAMYKADKKDERSTNALRLMSAFSVKPYSTWGNLFNQLIPYKNQLGGASYYQSIIDSIMVLFEDDEYEDNSPLSPLYLLGFSAQSRALKKDNKNKKDTEDEKNDITE